MSDPSPLPLVDGFGRVHSNLRISVTDRCNIRCFYCMPADTVKFLPKPQLLTFEEITRFARIAVGLGVTKLRLTGGEPLVRTDLPKLIEQLARLDGVTDLGLTTNGILLADQAADLYAAGLRRLNISLDALDPTVFREVTRRDGYDRVIAGIQTAQEIGFDSIKINALAIRNLTESQLVPFGQFARETGIEVRFIEYMPLDADAAWERDRVLSGRTIIETLSREIVRLEPVAGTDPSAPATEYAFADGVGRIGVIPSVTEPFCGNCNRFRITADGKLRNCLFSLTEFDVRDLLRSGASDNEIAEQIRTCLREKKFGHGINEPDFLQPERPMYAIGG